MKLIQSSGASICERFLKRTFVTAYNWLALAAVFAAPNVVSAATITWSGSGAGITMNADSDIVTNGTSVYAYDLANVNATVNGVSFTGLPSPGLNSTANVGLASSSSGTIAYNATVFAPSGGTGSPFYTTLSPAYQSILSGANYNTAYQAYSTVTLKNLTVGHVYAVQFWALDTRSTSATRGETVNYPIVNPKIAYNVNQAANGLGQYIIGVFTADSASQTFVLNCVIVVVGNGSTQINALQLRDVTGTGYQPPYIWNGGSTTNSYWSETTNWSGINLANNTESKMSFNGSKRLTNTNDLTGLTMDAISFLSANWNITGNPITLNGNVNASASGTSTWGLDTVLGVTPAFSQTAAGGVLNLTGAYSGANGIVVTSGSGAVNFTGTNNTFTGPVTVSGGTLGYGNLTDPGQNSSLGASTGSINVGSASSAAALSFVGSNNISTARGLAFTNNSSSAITLNNNSPNNANQIFNGTVSFYNATANNVSTYNLGGTSTGTNTFNGQWTSVNNIGGSFPGNLNISGPGTWVFNNIVGLTNNLNIGTNSHFVLGNGNGNSSLYSSNILVNPGGIFDVSAYSPSTPFILGAYAFQTVTAGQTNGTSANDIAGNFALGTTTLSIAGDSVPGVLTINGNFTPATGVGASMIHFDIANTTTAGSAVNDLIQVNGNLDLSQGTVKIPLNLLQGTFQTGTPYTLIAYTGSLVGNASGLNVLQFSRAYNNTVSTATAGLVTLTINPTGLLPVNGLLWSGANGQNWDLGTTANWLNNGSSDYFYSQDSPRFDDTASQFNISLVGSLMPTTVTVTNNLHDYTFSSGQISGPANLIKQGSANLNLNATNSYSGGTVISGGTLTLGANGAAGPGMIAITNGSLAFSTAITITNTIVGNGQINGATNQEVNFNNALLSGFAGGINVPATNTAQVDIVGTNANLGSAVVVNVGNGGTLFVNGSTIAGPINVSGFGNTNILGALRMGSGGVVSGPVTLQGNTSVGMTSGSSGTITGNIGDSGNSYALLKFGVGTLILAGANTYDGPTVVTNGGIVNVTGDESAATGGWLMTNNAVAGTVNFQLGSIINVAATNLVQLGGWIVLNGSAAETLNSYGMVTNNGSLLVGRTGTLNINNNVWVQNGGMTNSAPLGSGYSANMSVNPSATFIYNGASRINLSPASGSTGFGQLVINGGTFKTGQGFTNNVVTSGGGPAYLTITNNGTLAFLANVSGLLPTAGSTNIFRVGLANLDNGGFNITLLENITNAPAQSGTLTFTNTGTVTLTGTNLYTGSTTISGGGRLVVNGSLASSSVAVNAGTTLGGTGVINGTVSLAGTISPGGKTNVATLNTGAETWTDGSAYELSASNTVNGVGQDLLNINGLLTLPTDNAAVTVKLTSLTAANTLGALAGFNNTGNYSWTIATASGGIANFTPGAIVVDATGFANAFNGTFTVTTNGNSLMVTYSAGTGMTLVPPTISGTPSYSGGFNFSFSGPNGQTYKVLTSTNLTLPLANWTVLSTGTFGATPVNYTDTAATNGQNFYRVTSP